MSSVLFNICPDNLGSYCPLFIKICQFRLCSREFAFFQCWGHLCPLDTFLDAVVPFQHLLNNTDPGQVALKQFSNT